MNKSNKNKRVGSAKKPMSEENKMIVLLEAMRDDIKIVAEGHSVLNHKIDNVHQSLNDKIDNANQSLNQKIDSVHKSLSQKIDDNYDDLSGKLDVFKQEMSEFKNDTKSSFQTVFRYLSDIDNELKSIKLEITELKIALNEKADKEKLLELERRVISLEKELAMLR